MIPEANPPRPASKVLEPEPAPFRVTRPISRRYQRVPVSQRILRVRGRNE
jgi:hypothetical protein